MVSSIGCSEPQPGKNGLFIGSDLSCSRDNHLRDWRKTNRSISTLCPAKHMFPRPRAAPLASGDRFSHCLQIFCCRPGCEGPSCGCVIPDTPCICHICLYTLTPHQTTPMLAYYAIHGVSGDVQVHVTVLLESLQVLGSRMLADARRESSGAVQAHRSFKVETTLSEK